MMNNIKRMERKKIHSVESIRLKRIRYGFRVLIHLLFRDEIEKLHLEWLKTRDSIILEKEEQLKILFAQIPSKCSICGDQMNDLIFSPSRKRWFCIRCYEDAQNLYPENYL